MVHEATQTLLECLTPLQWAEAIRLYHENDDGGSARVIWYHIMEQEKRGQKDLHEKVLQFVPLITQQWLSRFIAIWA